jgi:hypothetical protein
VVKSSIYIYTYIYTNQPIWDDFVAGGIEFHHPFKFVIPLYIPLNTHVYPQPILIVYRVAPDKLLQVQPKGFRTAARRVFHGSPLIDADSNVQPAWSLEVPVRPVGYGSKFSNPLGRPGDHFGRWGTSKAPRAGSSPWPRWETAFFSTNAKGGWLLRSNMKIWLIRSKIYQVHIIDGLHMFAHVCTCLHICSSFFLKIPISRMGNTFRRTEHSDGHSISILKTHKIQVTGRDSNDGDMVVS